MHLFCLLCINSIEKKTGEHSHEVVYGVTSCKPEKANAEKVHKTNREHWSIEPNTATLKL